MFQANIYHTEKDEDKQKEARGVMLYGVIVLFVMVAVWGLVNVLLNGFGLATYDNITTKTVNTSNLIKE